MKLQKIIEVIETIAPVQDACEWDNVGLMIGLRDSEITKAVVSLDFDDNALNYAIENNAELIITHHPAIFRPLKNLNGQKTDFETFEMNYTVDESLLGGMVIRVGDRVVDTSIKNIQIDSLRVIFSFNIYLLDILVITEYIELIGVTTIISP